MDNPKLLERVLQICEDKTVEHAFEGVVEGYSPVEPVAQEQFYRTMAVRTEGGTRLVHFSTEKRVPLDVGDTVIVIGKDGWRGETSVLPMVLLHPKDRYVLVSREIRSRTRMESTLLGIPVVVTSVMLILWLVSSLVYWESSWVFPYALVLSACLMLAEFFVLELSKYLKRPRLFQCDEETWQELVKKVALKYSIRLSA